MFQKLRAMNGRRAALVTATALCLVMFLGVISAPHAPMATVQAAAVPTPIITGWNSDNVSTPIAWWNNQAITTSGATGSAVLGRYEALDTQCIVDQGTATNTVTITLQYSNDNEHWVNGNNILANSAVDVSQMTQDMNFGYYSRFYVTCANTETVTITLVSLAK